MSAKFEADFGPSSNSEHGDCHFIVAEGVRREEIVALVTLIIGRNVNPRAATELDQVKAEERIEERQGKIAVRLKKEMTPEEVQKWLSVFQDMYADEDVRAGIQAVIERGPTSEQN